MRYWLALGNEKNKRPNQMQKRHENSQKIWPFVFPTQLPYYTLSYILLIMLYRLYPCWSNPNLCLYTQTQLDLRHCISLPILCHLLLRNSVCPFFHVAVLIVILELLESNMKPQEPEVDAKIQTSPWSHHFHTWPSFPLNLPTVSSNIGKKSRQINHGTIINRKIPSPWQYRFVHPWHISSPLHSSWLGSPNSWLVVTFVPWCPGLLRRSWSRRQDHNLPCPTPRFWPAPRSWRGWHLCPKRSSPVTGGIFQWVVVRSDKKGPVSLWLLWKRAGKKYRI